MKRRLITFRFISLLFSLLFSLLSLTAISFPCAAAKGDDRLVSSLRSLEKKADAGDPEAMFRLARLYETGYGTIAPDTLRSINLYRDSAQKGFSPAENYYGFLLYNGVSGYLTADPDSAVSFIEKAAGKGDPKAANNLGWLFLEGKGISHDPEKAVHWFSKAAALGLPAAKAQLADLLKEGKGIEKDTLRAEKLYIEAIEGGIRDAEDKLLSMMHDRYMNLPASEALSKGLYLYLHRAPWAGVVLFERAAEDTSDSVVRAHALALLGDAYSRSQGVAYDHTKAMDYFHKAAEAGNPSAQYIIAEHLDLFPDYFSKESGNKETAAEWYAKAATAGITDASTAWQSLYRP